MYAALMVALSLPSIPLCWFLWTDGLPERFVPVRVPTALDVLTTSDSDYRGLV